MTPCRKCGGAVWEGPRYLTYEQHTSNGAFRPHPSWPGATGPHPEGLMYQCGICQYRVFAPTVENGGTPVPPPKRIGEAVDNKVTTGD